MHGLRNKICVILLVIALSAVPTLASFDSRVNLKGGETATAAHSIWQLYQYRDTTLLRRYPLCYCPYRSYLAANKYVRIECNRNLNWLIISPKLYESIQQDAEQNRQFATSFAVSGSKFWQVWQIWNYCRQTEYIPHVKYASDVFQKRQGDCAAIASAFYVLCKAHNIPVRYVIGWARNCHAWNRVKIRGRWYWIDPTQGKWLSRKQYAGRRVMEIW